MTFILVKLTCEPQSVEIAAPVGNYCPVLVASKTGTS